MKKGSDISYLWSFYEMDYSNRDYCSSIERLFSKIAECDSTQLETCKSIYNKYFNCKQIMSTLYNNVDIICLLCYNPRMR